MQYRVVVVQPDLIPYKGKIDVRVQDPNGNVISQAEGNELKKGEYFL